MSEERCIFCNAIIPEGRQVCPECETQKPKEAFSSFAKAIRFATEAVKELAVAAKEMLDKAQDLKILPTYYEAVKAGLKPFEVRSIKDRTFAVGDMLRLREYDGKEYTGRTLLVSVTYILAGGNYGIDPDYAVLGIKLLGEGL